MGSAGFGKRSAVARVAVRPAVTPAKIAAPVAPPAWSAISQSRIPFASLGILALLSLVFVIEMNHAPPEAPGTPSLDTLVALGGIGRALVFEHGQWWRIFTAPLMHGSVSHLVSNAIGLLLAGWLLETLIGRAWYTAIFVVGAVAGSIGSLLGSDAVVSIGASGAIMALLAAVLVWCIPFEDRARGKRLRRTAVWMFVTALLPAADGHVDLGAHLGGAVAGGILGFLLQIFWPETEERPGHTQLAAYISAAGLALSALSFALTAVFPTPKVGQEIQFKLIPPSEMPHSTEEGIERSADLVRRFPDDPRGHLLHAMSYLRLRQITDAQSEIRIAMARSDQPGIRDLPDFRISLRLMLAVTMSVQDRVGDARAVLNPGDCERAADPSATGLSPAYRQLRDTKICP
jgi:rhomboid protease GluP